MSNQGVTLAEALKVLRDIVDDFDDQETDNRGTVQRYLIEEAQKMLRKDRLFRLGGSDNDK